ncbi:MAG: hypothetical protein AB7I29_10835 [Geobacter sp.]
MAPDLLEDLAAFVYATRTLRKQTCPICGGELVESDNGDLTCPECDADAA